MFQRRDAHHSVERGQGDEVGEEDVGDEGGEEKEGEDFGAAAEDLLRVGPRGCVELAPGGGISFEPAFNAAENEVEEDGLRASPAAPDAAQQGGDEEDEHAQPGDGEEKIPDVAEVEGEAEEVKAARGDVEEDCGMPANLDPRQGDVNGDEQ